MTTRVLLNASDREQFFELVRSYKFPCTGNIVKGKDRTVEQNKLQRLWLNEASEQLGHNQTSEELRAYCKLHFGVPILREESEEFCTAYDAHIRPLTYESKLAFMSVPLDFPVTRLMTTKQKHDYLEQMRDYFTDLGVQLTIPNQEESHERQAAHG